jgi:hypothetical protein
MVNGESLEVNGQVDKVKILSQAAIGRALGLAPATMTKLKGQGMPVDSVESARTWRVARQNIAARKPEIKRPLENSTNPTLSQENQVPNQSQSGVDSLREIIRANEVKYDYSDMDEAHAEARTRREIAEANIAEIKEAELSGRYIEKTAVDRAVYEAARGLRDGMTNCSRRLASEVATLTTPAECEAVISKELRHLLDAFSRQLTQKITPSQTSGEA